jgi:hypothetical protein
VGLTSLPAPSALPRDVDSSKFSILGKKALANRHLYWRRCLRNEGPDSACPILLLTLLM